MKRLFNPDPFNPRVIGLSTLGNNQVDQINLDVYQEPPLNGDFNDWSNGADYVPDGWFLSGPGVVSQSMFAAPGYEFSAMLSGISDQLTFLGQPLTFDGQPLTFIP
jgi:hypothetical protein